MNWLQPSVDSLYLHAAAPAPIAEQYPVDCRQLLRSEPRTLGADKALLRGGIASQRLTQSVTVASQTAASCHWIRRPPPTNAGPAKSRGRPGTVIYVTWIRLIAVDAVGPHDESLNRLIYA